MVGRHSVEPALPTREARARASISGKRCVLVDTPDIAMIAKGSSQPIMVC